MKLKQTTTLVLFNDKGFTKPFFFVNDETLSDLIHYTKEQIKEMDMSWETDEQLKELVNAGISDLTENFEDLDMHSMLLLEGLVAIWCDINGFIGNEHIISMNISRNSETTSTSMVQIPYELDNKVTKSLKGVYKNEDTLVDTKLQSEVVKWVSIITTDKFMKIQMNHQTQSLDENYRNTKLVMVHLANLIQLFNDNSKKQEEFKNIFDMVFELKESYENDIMDNKIKNLLS